MGECLRVGIDARILEETAPMGVSRFMAALLRATAETAPQHEYILYFCHPSFAEPSFLQPPFFSRVLAGNRTLTSPLPWQQCYLPWQVWRDGVDVLFSPYYCGPLFCPVPQVVCISDISFSLFPQDFPSWIHFKPKLFARPSSWRATKVMTISEFSKHELVRVYGLPPEKIVVIQAGAEERLWRRERTQLQLCVQLPIAQPFFLFVGSLLPRRQIEAVVQALAQLPIQYHLVVVGETDAGKLGKLKAAACQWNVTERVQCLGHVSDEELTALYTRAVALVSPSTYEGFGLPILEAMVRGTPVIAWDIPVVREVVGDAGILAPVGNIVELASAMRRVGEDDPLRQTLRDSARRRAQCFSWNKAARTFLAVLQSAVEQR
jgi:glycosyltransferase involved in cell wall biosynthesis